MMVDNDEGGKLIFLVDVNPNRSDDGGKISFLVDKELISLAKKQRNLYHHLHRFAECPR